MNRLEAYVEASDAEVKRVNATLSDTNEQLQTAQRRQLEAETERDELVDRAKGLTLDLKALIEFSQKPPKLETPELSETPRRVLVPYEHGTDRFILRWCYDRLIRYGDNPRADFLMRLAGIMEAIPADQTSKAIGPDREAEEPGYRHGASC